jgi:DNA polymerase III gamma/tau subunit
MLIDVAKKEGFELDPGSAEILSTLADGSFRDALGGLQKILNFYLSEGKGSKNKKINREDVEKITGAPKTTLVNDFLSSIVEKDLEKGINIVREASSSS